MAVLILFEEDVDCFGRCILCLLVVHLHQPAIKDLIHYVVNLVEVFYQPVAEALVCHFQILFAIVVPPANDAGPEAVGNQVCLFNFQAVSWVDYLVLIGSLHSYE